MVRVYASVGRWRWFCDRCTAGSAHAYPTREQAEQLASRHACGNAARAI